MGGWICKCDKDDRTCKCEDKEAEREINIDYNEVQACIDDNTDVIERWNCVLDLGKDIAAP